MKPLLAHVYEAHRVTYPCYVQPKLNGIRALYQNGAFQSRDELPFPSGLLAHIAKPLAEIFGPDVILDGELYKHGWPLQRINAAVTPVRQQPTEDTLQVEYHVFDVVNFTENFAMRNVKLYKLGLVTAIRVATRLVSSDHEANSYYHAWVDSGYEGMMYRLDDCPYTVPKQREWYQQSNLTDGGLVRMQVAPPGRSKFWSDKNNRCWHLLKRKDWHDDEFQFVSLRETVGEKGKRGFVMTLKSKSSTKPFFDVGSGLTDSELDHYLANPPVGRLVKVKYLVLSVDQIPLNPTLLAVL